MSTDPVTVSPSPTGASAPSGDERLGRTAPLALVLRRPEVGALVASLVVGIFFALYARGFGELSGIANWTGVAATLGIPAVAVALLMIGGEFDLSAGVMVGTSGLVMSLLATEAGMNIWLAIVLTLLFAAGVGAINGYLVMRTKLPSFIVTLATFFILQGANLGVTKAITGAVAVSGLDQASGFDAARGVFGGTFWAPYNFQISVLWWIAVTLVATWALTRTRFGNWVYGVGGDLEAARNVGVPVVRVKITLFVGTALASALTGIIVALQISSAQASQGVGQELQFIVAAVVGGCLLTGGFGSAIGAALGALITGMAFIGIQFSGWNTDWRFLFLGVVLLLAVMLNTWIRKRASEARR
jgi:simple sugar transport system permease protein